MAVGDYLCEFKHLSEVDVSFAENTGQRLDVVKISQDYWRLLERERERERKREGEKERERKKERVVQRPSLGFP